MWIYYSKFRGQLAHLLHEPNGKKTPMGWQETLCGHLASKKYIVQAPEDMQKCKICMIRGKRDYPCV